MISGASRGAPRSGRYAIRSIVALSSPAEGHRRRASVTSTSGSHVPAPLAAVRGRRPSTANVAAIIAAEHEHVAVREVDQLEDAVDERVAERDERVDRTRREPDQEDLDEVAGVLTRLTPSQKDEQRRARAPTIGEPGRPDVGRRASCSRSGVGGTVGLLGERAGGGRPPPATSVAATSCGLRDLDEARRRRDHLERTSLPPLISCRS